MRNLGLPGVSFHDVLFVYRVPVSGELICCVHLMGAGVDVVMCCLCPYRVLVSMCPLSMESRTLAAAGLPAHFGPAVPEVNSVWLKLYLYQLTGSGPPSFCLTKGQNSTTD